MMSCAVLIQLLTNDLRHKQTIIEIKEWIMQKYKTVSPLTDGITKRSGSTIDTQENMCHRMCLMV